MNLFTIALLLLFFNACTIMDNTPEQTHTHTSKLQKRLSIGFEKIDILAFDFKAGHSDVSIKVLAVNKSSKQKETLLSKEINSSGTIAIPLPDNINAFEYFVAIIEATDTNGNRISSVETYKIGEQDQINTARDQLKK